MPNTRPASCNEYKHTPGQKHGYLDFDEEGICSACRFNEAKWDGTIDWAKREKELIKLLDKYRSKDGSHDVLVPGSGGKDSVFASHVLNSILDRSSIIAPSTIKTPFSKTEFAEPIKCAI